MKARSLGLAGICLLLQPVAGGAAVLNLEVAGTCLSSCLNVGLVDGDGIGGVIRVDDASYAPGALVGNEALKSYDFAFGNFSFNSADPPDPGFLMSWGEKPRSVEGFFILGFVSDDPERPGPALLLDTLLGGESVAAHEGYLRAIGCCQLEYGFNFPATLSVDSVEIAPIPLPATGLLLAGGLAGLAGLRLRRRAGEAA